MPNNSRSLGTSSFERFCVKLGRGGRINARPSNVPKELESHIEMARLDLSPEVVKKASRMMAFIVLAIGCPSSALLLVLSGPILAAVALVVSAAGSLASAQLILGHPGTLAGRRVQAMLRLSPEATNLMVMSLRFSPSISRALEFACRRPGEFSIELRKCVWDVMMGTQSSIEDSLLAFGRRIEKHGPEVKAAMNALVTASKEATEAGVRRSLDRANHAIVAGAKRRIEENTISLSTPSMLLFGLGILLPLMIGSFIQMLSWDLWSPDSGLESPNSSSPEGGILETALVMNLLFPAIALAIALSAAARHPLEPVSRKRLDAAAFPWRMAVAAVILSASATTASGVLLQGLVGSVAMLLSAVLPIAAAMMLMDRQSGPARGSEEQAEDVLFKLGARMLDGENFQSSLGRTSSDASQDRSDAISRLSLRHTALGQTFDKAAERERSEMGGSNVLDGLMVIHEAASKDEDSAGMLAMDIAAYLRDMREIASTLRTRLRPTISMMKATSHFLGPVVLGITFALYVSLTSIAHDGADDALASGFFVILGVFLAETNAVVVYFVHRMEGDRGKNMAAQLGECLLVSEAIYATTALVAS